MLNVFARWRTSIRVPRFHYLLSTVLSLWLSNKLLEFSLYEWLVVLFLQVHLKAFFIQLLVRDSCKRKFHIEKFFLYFKEYFLEFCSTLLLIFLLLSFLWLNFLRSLEAIFFLLYQLLNILLRCFLLSLLIIFYRFLRRKI